MINQVDIQEKFGPPTDFSIMTRVAQLAKQDRKNLLEKALKTSEETGELAQAVLSATGAPGCEYKRLTLDDVLKEAADVIICAASVAIEAGYRVEDIVSTMNKKLDAWEQKISQSNSSLN